jgi:hypothetical protein
MNTTTAILIAGFLLAMVSTSLPAQEAAPSSPLAHTRTEFHFEVNAAFEQVVPLFGANEERKWSPGWNPRSIYPATAHDQEGMVFQVAHGNFSSTWVNTTFDLANGHIQYAYVLNDAMATLIDIHLTREGPQKTVVSVVYERTALIAETNEHVEHFTKQDESARKEWGDAIQQYFAAQRAAKK